jgi:MFS superfamily sulfate permease-like transporter
MILPIKLVWGLQMRRGQKIAVLALFGSGLICVAFATLRVAQITKQSDKTGTATISATWLAVWSIVETSIAVCIGCCPAFAILWRAAHTPKVSYDTEGFVRHNQDPSQEDPYHPEAMKMDTMAVGPARRRESRRQMYWNDGASSQEELAADIRGIRVTYTVEQENRGPNTT